MLTQDNALWSAKLPECSTKPADQSVCVGCLIEVPSNCRLEDMPNCIEPAARFDWYGKGPATTLYGESALSNTSVTHTHALPLPAA